MKIVVVSPVVGGSFPAAVYCAKALKSLGHTVTFADMRIVAKDLTLWNNAQKSEDPNLTKLSAAFYLKTENIIMEHAEVLRADLVFALAQAPLRQGLLEELKDKNIKTAFWFVEHYRRFGYWQWQAPFYDAYFTIQEEPFLSELNKLQTPAASYLPNAALPEFHQRCSLSAEEQAHYGCDLAFVGMPYPNRLQLFAELVDFDLGLWGPAWDKEPALKPFLRDEGKFVDQQEELRIYSAAKIVINLHSSGLQDSEEEPDFVNPRTFVLAACQTFQLIDERSLLSDLFEPGKEIVTFSDTADLRDKIRFYLDHPQERQAIAQRAYERVMKEHTYQHRMQQMLQVLQDN